MSGKAQHEIPRLFLRGFLIPENDGTEQVWVYRRGALKPFVSNIDRAAAQGYFYSRPDVAGGRTLDDEITDYENRLGSLVGALRRLPAGAAAPRPVVAEVLAHLIFRNAHLRGAFSQGLKEIVAAAREKFGGRDKLSALMGLDVITPDDRFAGHFERALADLPHLLELGVPRPVLERIAFCLAKENFDDDYMGTRVEVIDEMLSRLEGEAEIAARKGQVQALSQNITPPAHVERFEAYNWIVCDTPEGVPLPDCVALARHSAGDWHPLAMADGDLIDLIALPLTAQTLLLGSKDGSPHVGACEFTAASVGCSLVYFIAPWNRVELVELLPRLGERALVIIGEGIRSGVEEAFPTPQPERDVIAAAEAETPQHNLGMPATVTLTFKGDFDEDERQALTAAVSEILGEASWTIPLSRLDGITFADDYTEAARALELGVDGTAADRPQAEKLSGVARAATVVLEGIVKVHVVLDGRLARLILHGDPAVRAIPVHTLVRQLGLVGCIEVIDEALSNDARTQSFGVFDHVMWGCVGAGWQGYFSSRASAAFNLDADRGDAEVLTQGLRDALALIPPARLAYRVHGDLDVLLHTAVLPRITFILQHAANLFGHRDGLERDPLDQDLDLQSALDALGLRRWFANYHEALQRLWDRRGAWESVAEFQALNVLIERLLWAFGIIPWAKDDGGLYIEIPIHSDLAALAVMTNDDCGRTD